MCGIVAIIGKTRNIENKLKTSLIKISHRGSHRLEYAVVKQAALGANRLGIVDDKKGAQPQQNEKGNVFAIFNGEIFNFKNLQEKLALAGYNIRTDNDTEVLVHLWEEYKEKLINKLDSEMFAFVIWDKKNNQVFAARDAIGVKPLYYAMNEQGVIFFASEIKALVCHKEIKDVHEFPVGHYFYKGKFTKYFRIKKMKVSKDPIKSINNAVEEAVFKRVQTSLPLAVFLSGGVDSSLVMELATRYHPNVTALILGEVSSPDYKSAVKLAKAKKWKYRVLKPKIDYKKKLSKLIYFLEAYDPNIVRQSFANDAISEFAHKLGFKIALTGEGIDELFAGYNEFLKIEKAKVDKGCQLLLKSMSNGNLMRVDKMAMRYTVETRSPFFDNKLINIAMNLTGDLKVGMYKNKEYTKLIFRKAALKYLPGYIVFRDKAAFANGAGMDVGINYKKADGVFNKIAEKEIGDKEFVKIKNLYKEYKLETKEEVLFFKEYKKYNFDKFTEGRNRLIVKDTLYSI